MTYIADHDLLARIRFGIGSTRAIEAHGTGTCKSASTIAVHPQSARSCLLIRTRIICVKILIREIAACTRLCCETTRKASSESTSQSTSTPETTRASTEASTTEAAGTRKAGIPILHS
jgi:hypothetical protein